MASIEDRNTLSTPPAQVLQSDKPSKSAKKRTSKDKSKAVASKKSVTARSHELPDSFFAEQSDGKARRASEDSCGVRSWQDELGDISLSGLSDVAGNQNYSEVMKFVERQSSSNVTNSGNVTTDHFQIILMAPTSAAIPISQESLTYINQGQSYEVLCKKLGPDNQPLPNGKYRTAVSLCFHERRHKFEEKRLIDEWRKCHPGELPLAADTPVSVNVSKVHSGGTYVEFVWDSAHTTSMYIKVNMISTEFSARKHGGEKGVPFRLTISSFRFDADNQTGGPLLHSCYAPIRVFRLKGADRRNRLDRERAEKNLDSERFQPAYDYTIMTETFPNDMSNCELDPEYLGSIDGKYDMGLKMVGQENDQAGSKKTVSDKSDSNPTDATVSNDMTYTIAGFKLLSPSATVSETTTWLKANRFGRYSDTFCNFNAADLLRLSVESISRLVPSVADAYRLFNALRARDCEPKVKFYLRLTEQPVFTAIFLQDVTASELARRVLASLLNGGVTDDGKPITISEIVWRSDTYDILVKRRGSDDGHLFSVHGDLSARRDGVRVGASRAGESAERRRDGRRQTDHHLRDRLALRHLRHSRQVFTAIFLQDVTASELARRVLASLLNGGVTDDGKPITISEIVWRSDTYDILVKVTDELVASWDDGQAFSTQLTDDNTDIAIIGGNVVEVAATKRLILSSVEKVN